MRVYYVIRDGGTTKKTAEQRRQLIADLPVKDLEGNTPDRQLNPTKVSADGSMWLGGIELDGTALEKLNQREQTGTAIQAKLVSLIQRELRALLASNERARFTVEVVGYDSPTTSAVQMVQEWLAANWVYPDERTGGDTKPAVGRT